MHDVIMRKEEYVTIFKETFSAINNEELNLLAPELFF